MISQIYPWASASLLGGKLQRRYRADPLPGVGGGALGEGRIVLPETLKEHASITTDVAFVGLGAMFQMWEPARYAEHRATVRERSRRQGTTLPARGGSARRPS